MDQKPVTPRSGDATQSQSVDRDETLDVPEADSDTKPTVFEPPMAEGEVGTLGSYRIIKELGHGGMGAVYAAVDTRLDRRLAMKVMLPQAAAHPSARERFLREARAAARIKHDNVVTIYEADERNGVPYIAMEFLAGSPLDEYLKKKGNPSMAQVLRIAMETAAGLDAAHTLGLIHRDIKPGNLWLEAPKGRVKVLDFGLAKMVDTQVELTKSGTLVGTPAYMSPEQARGERVDARSDLFSLGGVMYRLCTGRLPFQGASTMAVLMALGTEEPPPVRNLNPSVPEALAELIHQLLAKKVDARPQTAAEVVTRLRAIAAASAAPQALPATSSPSRPQVVYVPISVIAQPSEANPFADIDASVTEMAPPSATPATATKPARKKPALSSPWVLAGAFAFIALAVYGVIIIKNKDGTETKLEVPDGATRTIQDKSGKNLAKVGPSSKPPVADNTPERKAAEWVLSMGGSVKVNGEERYINAAGELPQGAFTLTVVELGNRGAVTDAGLANLKDCKNLTVLHLGGTQVTDAGLANLKDCKNLSWLYLGETKISDAGLANFNDCKNLTILNLGGTQISDVGLVNLKDCKNLTYLHLGDTQVTDTGLVNFKDCKYLTQLYLYHTPVSDTGLANFNDCKYLTQLHLGGTQVTDTGLANFKDCKNLITLDLYNTKVTDAGLANFKDCKKLTQLDLQNLQISDDGLVNFKDCKNLRELHLDATQVSDEGLANFKDCKKLTTLAVQKTNVTAKGLIEFHAAVPGCRIEHDGGIIEPKK